MIWPENGSEWILFGIASLLLLYGAWCGIVNWCIFLYNVVHHYIRRDEKYSSFVPLVPILCFLLGCKLYTPYGDYIWLLLLLDGELSVVLLFPLWCISRLLKQIRSRK